MSRVLFTLVFLLSSCFLFSQAGVPDSTFAEDGILNWDVTGNPGMERGNTIAVQPDGKIVVGLTGGFADFNNDAGVVRLNADGSVDSTFATNGIYYYPNPIAYDVASQVKILENGKILIVGWYSASTTNTDLLLIQLNADGTPDADFGEDGVVIKAVGLGGGYDYGRCLAIDKEGKILVGGESTNPVQPYHSNIICRFDAHGQIDTTFGDEGVFEWNPDASDKSIHAIAIANDGKIIAAGSSSPNGTPKPTIYKVMEDGSALDTTFATNGEVLAPWEATAYGMILHSNGDIMITGSNQTAEGRDLIILAYTKDGTPDTDFGIDGVFKINVGVMDDAYALAEQQDGKIIAAGSIGGGPLSGPHNFYSVRIDASGNLDTSWGQAGYVITHTSDFNAFANALTIQSDGKVLLTGLADINGSTLQVVRYGNFIDADGDGYELNDDCDDTNFAVNPGVEEVPYNGLDDDCNGETPDDDLDGDGFNFAEDCDETNPDINPDAIEIPDNDIDEDCDGNDLVGLLEIELAQQFKVYPNPTRSKVYIKSAPGMPDVEFIQLHDYTGKPVKVINNTSSGEWSVDLKNLPQGLWLLSIHSKEGVVVKRIIKSN